MQNLIADEVYLGIGNTITARTEDGTEISGITSSKPRLDGNSGRSVEIAMYWGSGLPRTYLFVPMRAIVAINGEAVTLR